MILGLAPSRLVTSAILLFLSVCVLQTAYAQQVWQQASGLDGGSVNAVVMQNETEFFAGTDVGLYYTSDAGEHWVQRGFKSATVYALARVEDVLYAGIGFSQEDGFGGVFRSTNNGLIWERNLEGQEVWSLHMQDDLLLVGTAEHGLFSSPDGGTWTQSLEGNAVYAIHRFNDVIVVATDSAVFRSTDLGQSWSKNDLSARGTFYCFASTETMLYAGGDNGVFKSTDHGATWTIAAMRGQTIYSLAADAERLYIGSDTSGVVVRSHASANLVASDFGNESVYALAVTGNTVLAGTWEDGAFVSNDKAASFIEKNTGLKAAPMYCFSRDQGVLYAGGDGVARSLDEGKNWEWLSLYATVYALHTQGDRLLAFSEDGLYTSTDDGENWSLSAMNGMGLYCVLQDRDRLLCGTAEQGLWQSTDNAKTWSQSSLSKGTVNAILRQGQNLYLAMGDGHVLRSSDDTKSWTEVLFDSTAAVQSLCTKGSVLIAGTAGNDVFLSNDNGQSWEHRLLNPILLCDVQAMDVAEPQIYAATYSYGIYTSIDNGMNWSAFNDSLDNRYTLAVTHNDKLLLCSTEGQGVWYRALPTTSVPEQTQSRMSIVPQPATDFIRIDLPIGLQDDAEFGLYDLNGNCHVHSTALSRLSASNALRVDCRDLPTGMYQVRIVQHNQSWVKSVVIVR